MVPPCFNYSNKKTPCGALIIRLILIRRFVFSKPVCTELVEATHFGIILRSPSVILSYAARLVGAKLKRFID